MYVELYCIMALIYFSRSLAIGFWLIDSYARAWSIEEIVLFDVWVMRWNKAAYEFMIIQKVSIRCLWFLMRSSNAKTLKENNQF